VTCVSVPETVAEKLVALTGRAGAEFAQAGGPRDPTLVRHIYDLHCIRHRYDPLDVVALSREIMLADVAAYGHQFPAYREDPVLETVRAGHRMAASKTFAQQYEGFLREMVYGESIPFDSAVSTLLELVERF
ncbi:MAG TPA: nucleotidyl transferase AbiEii/AbiGii toxin family protein, partial [Bryobacteraceae bacterium]|nr:nucleotidyl transferase AbiEii/AbiGii toxin family protein [Bryobacteraceae bacterium]